LTRGSSEFGDFIGQGNVVRQVLPALYLCRVFTHDSLMLLSNAVGHAIEIGFGDTVRFANRS
jgi:hypothetical protein